MAFGKSALVELGEFSGFRASVSCYLSAMPIETTPVSGLQYHLIAFDEKGRERTDDPAGRMSERIVTALREAPITDIFVLSHGWQGDVPSARSQYNKWIDAAASCATDRERLAQSRPGFRPMIVGFHWPSLAWGDEELPRGGGSFAAGAGTTIDTLVEEYARRLEDTPATRAALRTILESALQNIAPDTLPADVREAYLTLDREAALGSEGPEAAPSADREPFNPDRVYEATMENVSFGFPGLGALLAPLRALTFWKMKDRAKSVGETAGHTLLKQVLGAAGANVRVHLAGHSFGCIVVSASLAGPGGRGALPRPAHSLLLMQGALSLWSYCSDIPYARGRAGFFRSIISDRKVTGPIVTTISAKDTAVGRFYPIGAGARGDVQFAPGTFPKYGGVGSFGVRGPGLEIVDLPMRAVSEPYEFAPGKIYNLESTRYICEGGGTSGAHSDIAKPEVGHAFWSAAR
jgi:hypothetical protein